MSVGKQNFSTQLAPVSHPLNETPCVPTTTHYKTTSFTLLFSPHFPNNNHNAIAPSAFQKDFSALSCPLLIQIIDGHFCKLKESLTELFQSPELELVLSQLLIQFSSLRKRQKEKMKEGKYLNFSQFYFIFHYMMQR